jgi:hypothetical protein
MSNKVHLLIGFETYYPSPDNTLRVFNDREAAEEVLKDLETLSGNPKYKKRYSELLEKYPWLPEYSSEHYDVVTHEVHTHE